MASWTVVADGERASIDPLCKVEGRSDGEDFPGARLRLDPQEWVSRNGPAVVMLLMLSVEAFRPSQLSWP
jgi:hypothetical protein